MSNPASRILVAASLFALALLVIVGRLWWLQLTHWSAYASEASFGNRTRVEYRPAPRGTIYDRSGRVLAENREVWNLSIIPSRLPTDGAQLQSEIAYIASAISTEETPVSTADVKDALKDLGGAGLLEAQPLGKLGHDLSFDQVAVIEEGQIEHPGVVVTTSTIRHYPFGALAGHALGYVRSIDDKSLEKVKEYTYPEDPNDPTLHDLGSDRDLVYGMQAVYGHGGVEELLEMDTSGDPPVPILPGRRGRVEYEVDASLSPRRLIAERPPVPGAEVWLTLDARVQHVAERALTRAIRGLPDGSGAIVVLDVRNGDVVALASVPCLDLNDWVRGYTKEQWAQIQNDRALPLLNRAIAGRYPPGSVFKVVSACAALETTKMTPATTAYCAGFIKEGRANQIYKCWVADRGGHGPVSFLEAIAKSCNVYFYEAVRVWSLDPVQIARYARRFGLGQGTGLGLPGEVAGEVPAPRYGPSEADQQWTRGHSLNFVIGQDRLTVTPLQMAVVCAAVANGGHMLTPSITKRIRWPAYTHRPDTVNTVGKALPLEVKPGTLELVRQGMRLAVTGDKGTARGLSGLSLSIAGKTGSAQHIPGKPAHSWFIGFAPYSNPQYAVASFIACGGSGSERAVPAAGHVFRALSSLMAGVPRHSLEDDSFELPPPTSAAEVAEARRKRMAEARARQEETRAAAKEEEEED